MQASRKLPVENSIDGYHASFTHDTCFKYLIWPGAGLRRPGGRRHQGSERWPRGAGIPGAPGPRGRQAGTAVRAPEQVIEALRTRLAAEHGAERARRIGDFNRTMLLCPWRVRPPRTTSRRWTPSVPVKPARYPGHVVLVLPRGEAHPRDPAAAPDDRTGLMNASLTRASAAVTRPACRAGGG